MSDSSSKIITTFQDRLALDTAVKSLADTTSAAQIRQRAAEIAAKFGDRAIPALVGHLNTTDPQMRGGLGMLAAMLDYEKTTAALRAAARNRALDDQARLTAITILDRYLNIVPDEDMYQGMGAPEEAALRSLREVLADQQTDPLVLVEYFRQLELQPLDVQLTMARAARRLEAAEAVPMLRMFAQSPTHLIAQESLQALSALATPDAAGALQGLHPDAATRSALDGRARHCKSCGCAAMLCRRCARPPRVFAVWRHRPTAAAVSIWCSSCPLAATGPA